MRQQALKVRRWKSVVRRDLIRHLSFWGEPIVQGGLGAKNSVRVGRKGDSIKFTCKLRTKEQGYKVDVELERARKKTIN